MVAAAIPYAAAGVQALGQIVSGAAKKRQANQMALPETDPTQLAMLDEVNRKRQQLEMGTGAEFENLRRQTAQAQGQTQANVLRAGGGNVGAVMQGLNIAQQGAGNLYAQGAAPLVQKAGQYQMLAKQMVDDIAKRKFEVQQWQKLQKMREAAELTQAGMQNVFPAALGMTYTMGGDQTRGILDKFMGNTTTNPQIAPLANMSSMRTNNIPTSTVNTDNAFANYTQRPETNVMPYMLYNNSLPSNY